MFISGSTTMSRMWMYRPVFTQIELKAGLSVNSGLDWTGLDWTGLGPSFDWICPKYDWSGRGGIGGFEDTGLGDLGIR